MKKDNTNLIDRIIYIFFFVALLLLAIGFYFLFSDIKQSVFAEEKKELVQNYTDKNSLELYSDLDLSTYRDLSLPNTRTLSDFSTYYSNISVSDYNFNNIFLSWTSDVLPINKSSSAKNYFGSIFGVDMSSGNYTFNLRNYGAEIRFNVAASSSPNMLYSLDYITFENSTGGYVTFTVSFYGNSYPNNNNPIKLLTVCSFAAASQAQLDNRSMLKNVFIVNYGALTNAFLSCENGSSFGSSFFYFSPFLNTSFSGSDFTFVYSPYRFVINDTPTRVNMILDVRIYSGVFSYPVDLSTYTSNAVISIPFTDFTVDDILLSFTVDLSDYSDIIDIYHDFLIVIDFNFSYNLYGSGSVTRFGSSLPYLVASGIEVPRITLSAPVVTIQNNILSWDSVEYAEYYIIRRVSDNVTYYVDNYTYNSYVVSVNGDYSVQACNSDTTSYIDSVYSNVISVTDFHDTQYSFLLLMSSIMDSILYLFKSFLNYEVLGVNMFGAFGAFLFICLILFFIRKFRGD